MNIPRCSHIFQIADKSPILSEDSAHQVMEPISYDAKKVGMRFCPVCGEPLGDMWPEYKVKSP